VDDGEVNAIDTEADETTGVLGEDALTIDITVMIDAIAGDPDTIVGDPDTPRVGDETT
jgi:hypothetical protein